MPKVILISQSPLPTTKNGSWTTLYKNYLEVDHKIDTIICKKPKLLFKKINSTTINHVLLPELTTSKTISRFGYFIGMIFRKVFKKNKKTIL